MSQADDKNRISAITGTYQILCFQQKNSWLTYNYMYNLLVDQMFWFEYFLGFHSNKFESAYYKDDLC